APDERKMTVVLPFENLGPAEEAYFAAGVTEEITSRLATVSGMGVISRTSAVQYDRTGKNMKQIGEDLGVDYVLEGSVRWGRNPDGTGRVRITPQLIQVSDDTHLWSDTYDRDIVDIFEVQTDIANQVIEQLGVTLLGSERERIQEKPTQNIEAYQLYLQARDLAVGLTAEYDRRKVELLERATELDPRFVAPLYELCLHHSNWYRILERTETRLARAREVLQKAEAVDREHHLTRLARGYYYYYGFRDYDRALEEFVAASRSVPNDSEARRSIGYIQRRKGNWQECIDDLQAAFELDPQSKEVAVNLAATYLGMREYEEAIRYLDRAFSLDPDDYESVSNKAFAYICWKGDLEAAREIMKEKPKANPTSYYYMLYLVHTMERDFAGAIETARKLEETTGFVRALRQFMIAIAETGQKGPKAAIGTLETTAGLCEDILRTAPSNGIVRQWLAITYALLGRENEAIREAKLAVDLTAKDAFAGPSALENLALVYAHTNRHDEAIDLIERLLSTVYRSAITVHLLRLHPGWDPLREHPRFQSLLQTKHL
ncbi:MAG: tetratricopeptide repeat protein, partial [Candidatus Krumholzibacteria bacterium]|nr:tetratricopeptide repeat protein [Candidatus Krumholzibacteria bacterium]